MSTNKAILVVAGEPYSVFSEILFKLYKRYKLKNPLITPLTSALLLFSGWLNGALVIEIIFGWPGIGKLMIDSIMQRDFAVVQASILVTAIVILSINIIIDIAYAVLDPRIRHK